MFSRHRTSTRRCPRAWAVVTALAVAGVTLVGCGPGDTSSVAACASPGVSDDRIDLGVLYPDSGPVSPIFEAARAGIDARLGAVNAAGGINGRRVVYQWRDDQGSPLANGIAARDLVDQRRVFGVVELSVAASGSAGYLAQQGVPVTGLASEQVWSQDRNMFAATTATDAAVDTQGRFVRDQGGSRAVILQTALSAGISTTASTYARSLAAAGVQVLGAVTFTTGVDDPVAVARRIVAARADTIVGIIEPKDLVAVLTVLRNAGHNPKVVLSANGYDHALLRAVGPQAAGISVPVFYKPFEIGGPGINAYLAAMRQFAPQVAQPEQDIAVISYISADIFLRGLQLAGSCPTRQGFIDGLRAVNSYDADGLISTISFRAGAARPTTCYSFVQANPAGNGYVVVEPNLCGHELSP